jgi:ubiquitin-protein ligase
LHINIFIIFYNVSSKIEQRKKVARRKVKISLLSGYIVEIESDNIWKINIAGPDQTPFEGGQFVVKFKLEQFPFKSPVVTLETKIYHPNVDKDGGICADMLEIGEKWAPVKNLYKIMDKIKSLLAAPNLESPLNAEAAQDYKNGTWEKKAR